MQPAEPSEARMASRHHPGARLGLRSGRDHAADRDVEADGAGAGGTASSPRASTVCSGDATRPPGKKPVPEGQVQALVALAMSPPPEHARHWTVRALARRLGMVISTVHGILKDHGLRPHQVKTFKVSRDPRFEIKVRDVVGLYVDPPDHAVILSVDEKTQIQALGRTQRPLPMKPGHARDQDPRLQAERHHLPAGGSRRRHRQGRPARRSNGTARKSSSPSSTMSPRASRPAPRCMSSSTTSHPTSRPRSTNG